MTDIHNNIVMYWYCYHCVCILQWDPINSISHRSVLRPILRWTLIHYGWGGRVTQTPISILDDNSTESNRKRMWSVLIRALVWIFSVCDCACNQCLINNVSCWWWLRQHTWPGGARYGGWRYQPGKVTLMLRDYTTCILDNRVIKSQQENSESLVGGS